MRRRRQRGFLALIFLLVFLFVFYPRQRALPRLRVAGSEVAVFELDTRSVSSHAPEARKRAFINSNFHALEARGELDIQARGQQHYASDLWGRTDAQTFGYLPNRIRTTGPSPLLSQAPAPLERKRRDATQARLDEIPAKLKSPGDEASEKDFLDPSEYHEIAWDGRQGFQSVAPSMRHLRDLLRRHAEAAGHKAPDFLRAGPVPLPPDGGPVDPSPPTPAELASVRPPEESRSKRRPHQGRHWHGPTHLHDGDWRGFLLPSRRWVWILKSKQRWWTRWGQRTYVWRDGRWAAYPSSSPTR